MSFYDIVMLVVLGGAIWFGFWKGLAWQVASVAAVCVSYIVAVNFREPVSHFIQAEEPWNRIGAMLVLFLATSIVIWIIYARIKGTIQRMELKGFDRQAGAMMGALKGVLLAMVITIFSVSLLGPKAHDSIHTSKFGPYFISGISKLSAIVPAELFEYIRPHVDNFHQQIGHNGTRPISSYPNAAALPGAGVITGAVSQYQTGGGFQQNPNQLPAAQTGYRGQWQQAPQANSQYAQPNSQPYAQPNNWNQGYNNQSAPAPTNTQGYFGNNGFQARPATQQQSNNGFQARPATQQQPGTSPFNGASQELFNGARQVLGEAVGEAAKRAFEAQR